MLVSALQSVSEVERALGNESFAQAWQEQADRLKREIVRLFWCEERGLLSDDREKSEFSEHVQCLAILTRTVEGERRKRVGNGLIEAKDLVQCSSYFAHYLFNAYVELARTDLILKRFDVWRAFLKSGAKTAFETQGLEARSDCHAWSACPLYWLATGVAGISPAAPFFRRVRIAPQPAGLGRICCRVPHPDGVIELDLDFSGDGCRGRVRLPPGLPGDFIWKGQSFSIPEDGQPFDVKPQNGSQSSHSGRGLRPRRHDNSEMLTLS